MTDDAPTFNALLRAERPDNGAAELARRAIECAEQARADAAAVAQAAVEERARAEAAPRFNDLIHAAATKPEPEQPTSNAPTHPTGSADGGEGEEEGATYEYVQTEAGIERMRVFPIEND